VLLLASRNEMNQPYLSPLRDLLAPRVLDQKHGKPPVWRTVEATLRPVVAPGVEGDPSRLGSQITRRKSLRPVMSHEQQQLCDLKLDGGPRLVRGVAGSGKTDVLAHWLHKTRKSLEGQPNATIWAVYANDKLGRLIKDKIEESNTTDPQSTASPKYETLHVRDLLNFLLPQVGLRLPTEREERAFEYDYWAEKYLEKVPPESVEQRCQAMFVDEAQDMGPNMLRLLAALVKPRIGSDPRKRQVNIFYDNAQNIYGRKMPVWSELGIDLRGRSTVMKESFRSTRPIAEFALNVLYRLQPPNDNDHKELVDRHLIEKIELGEGISWWSIRYNQVDGPNPVYKSFEDQDNEMEAIGKQVVKWICDEGVKPNDICIIYNGKANLKSLKEVLDRRLKKINCSYAVLNEGGSLGENDVWVSTPHSFKGWEAEIVVIAGAEGFVTRDGKDLPNHLYVAMTRARSMLSIYAVKENRANEATKRVLNALYECSDCLIQRPKFEQGHAGISVDDFEEIIQRLGDSPSNREWLVKLSKQFAIQQERILADDGEILGEPLFWFETGATKFACFGKIDPGERVRFTLQDNGVQIIEPGSELPKSS
jgi:superfamily I DNA/RNA helicase